jgi:hypothetical protein
MGLVGGDVGWARISSEIRSRIRQGIRGRRAWVPRSTRRPATMTRICKTGGRAGGGGSRLLARA